MHRKEHESRLRWTPQGQVFERPRILGAVREPDEVPRGALYGRWILVIDDDPAVRVLSARVLLEYGAVCQLASTHDGALQILAREPRFNVALLDFTMPDGEGTELVPQLRTVRPALEIIGTSGADRSLEFEQAGVKRFLQKPWGIEDLIALLAA